MTLKTEFTFGLFRQCPNNVAYRVIEGEEITITYNGKAWALLTKIDVRLPEDGNYSFAGLDGLKNGRDILLIKTNFANGKPVVLKDYPPNARAWPLSLRPNKNIILMRPL